MKKAGETLLSPLRKNRTNGFYGFINQHKELIKCLYPLFHLPPEL